MGYGIISPMKRAPTKYTEELNIGHF